MNKHAYLIIAHNNWHILEKLILLLDDERNDIYIHIDKKVKDFDKDFFENLPKKSQIHIYSQIKIYWGDYSQIECELFLLKKSISNKYQYYHLISGVDLPIKSQDYIHKFFDNNYGCEFIHYQSNDYVIENYKNIKERVSIYHYYQKHKNRSSGLAKLCIRVIDKISRELQYMIKLDRWKKNKDDIKFGSNWISITNELATFIIKNEEEIEKRYKYTSCADEVFVQTLAYNSYFKDRLYNKKFNNDITSNMRLIDWKRGYNKRNPYIWHKEDFNELMNSECLFARKFDYNTDSEIVDKLYVKLRKGNII